MSKPTPTHRATVENGRLILRDKERFQAWLGTLRGDVQVIVEKRKSTRSNRQNRYYWAYMTIIENDTGDAANDLHELFKRTCLPPVYKTILGKEVKLPATTTTLDPAEFTDYIHKIEMLTGIPAPNPDDLYYGSDFEEGQGRAQQAFTPARAPARRGVVPQMQTEKTRTPAVAHLPQGQVSPHGI